MMPHTVSAKTGSQRVSASQSPGEPCPGCRRSLPIRAKHADEVAAHWECDSCRTPVTGILVRDVGAKLAPQIRLAQANFETSDVAPIPDGLRQLVQAFAARRNKSPAIDNSRQEARIPSQLDVTIVGLDDRWTPTGKPQLGVVVDLSADGLGLITDTVIESKRVALQIRHPSGPVQLLGDVVWSNKIGPGYQNAGVKFALRLGRGGTAG